MGTPKILVAFFTYDDVTFGVLYTGNLKEENCLLLKEMRNRALIDTGCSATVCGRDWAEWILVRTKPGQSRKVSE